MGIATEWKRRRKRKTLPRTHHSSARVNTTRLTNPFVSRAVFSLEESSSVPPPKKKCSRFPPFSAGGEKCT